MKLKFSPENVKTQKLRKIPSLQKYLQSGRKIYSLDLPAGHSCPGANECLARCVNGKIKDGPNTRFRCFSASQEVAFPYTHAARQHNLNLLKGLGRKQILQYLLHSLPLDAGIIRLHVSGDFFKFSYLQAVVDLSEIHRSILFYCYTKSLHLLQRIKGENLPRGLLRPNFLVTASRGGKYDNLISKLKVREVVVVNYPDDTLLNIDQNDSHAATPGGSFALLVHGIQPAGTKEMKAVQSRKGKK